MLRFFTNTLEPISYSIFLGFFSFYLLKENKRRIWALVVYYLASTLLMIAATQRVFSNTNNIALYNLHLLNTSLIYCYLFYHLLNHSYKKRIFWSAAIISLGYYVTKNMLLKETAAFDSAGYSAVSGFVLFCVFLYFRQELKKFDGSEIFLTFNFWYASSLVLYYLGSFIIFLSYYFLTSEIINDYTDKQRDTLTLLWGLHNILLFLSSLITISGTLWVIFRRK